MSAIPSPNLQSADFAHYMLYLHIMQNKSLLVVLICILTSGSTCSDRPGSVPGSSVICKKKNVKPM